MEILVTIDRHRGLRAMGKGPVDPVETYPKDYELTIRENKAWHNCCASGGIGKYVWEDWEDCESSTGNYWYTEDTIK